MEDQSSLSNMQIQNSGTAPEVSDADKRRLKSVIISNNKENSEMEQNEGSLKRQKRKKKNRADKHGKDISTKVKALVPTGYIDKNQEWETNLKKKPLKTK